jgi:PAS domain S-box-containing protein
MAIDHSTRSTLSPPPGGITGAAIRARDWSSSAVGPMAQWPQTLRSVLSLMLNSPQSMYLAWGPELTFFFNDAYRPILGPRIDDALGKTLVTLWPDAWEQVRPMVEQAQLGQSCRHENLPLTLARYGVEEQTWWSFSFSPIFDEHEQTVLGVLCHTTETSEAMRVEAQLRETQQFNSRVLASSNDCIKVLDLDGRLAFMSEGGMEVMEVSDFNAIRGCPWPDFWRDQGNLDAKAAIAGAKVGLSGRFQGAAETLLGNSKWWDVQVTPMLDKHGNTEKILCISRDITATREAEEDLRRLNITLEERVEARTRDRDRIWRLSTDLMLIAQFSGEIMAVNPAWTQVLGWSQEELLGSSFHDYLHPEDGGSTTMAAQKLAQGLSFRSFENRYRHKDGSYRWIAWTAVPDMTYIHAVGRDIQVEREAAEALRKTEDALRQSQKMEAVGQLTGGVAHDFNNLLTVVKASTDLLKRSLDEERRRRYIDAISDAVDRASKLTGQLLAFARQQTLRPEVFDAGISVKAIGEMIGALTGARINVVIDLPEQPCLINADAAQFDTALINMAVNARDAMNGEGTLSISIEPVNQLPARRAHPAMAGEYVAVSLTDTGSGIAPEQLDRIFDPFFTTKEVGKGTGLGLSQVFGFAKQSGGEVMVQSDVQRGTRFTLYLPRSVVTSVNAQPLTLQDAQSDGEGATLLVVEDNLHVGEFSTQTLRELGYHIHWAKNGGEALQMLADQAATFHAVFSDVVMPGMNGVDLALEIRRLYPDLPIILTSGYSPALAQGNSQGFTFLQKPYSVEALARLLRGVIKPS